MKLRIRRIFYEDIDINRDKLITVSEAAKILGITSPGVVRALERGALTALVDPTKIKYKGSTLLMREEVEKLAEKRKGKAEEM